VTFITSLKPVQYYNSTTPRTEQQPPRGTLQKTFIMQATIHKSKPCY